MSFSSGIGCGGDSWVVIVGLCSVGVFLFVFFFFAELL